MKQSGYSVHVHWDKRYPKKGTGKCPVQISVSINGLQFKIGLKLYASKEEFEKAMSGKSGTKEVKELRSEINKYVTKAESILENMPIASREAFQRLFKSETDLFASNKTDVSYHFEEYIANLEKEERFQTAANCRQAYRSLKKYKANLYFEDMDATFLNKYRNWVVNSGCSPTTAQIYLRNLRIIFNKAIKEGYIASRFYPFANFTIGTSAKSKDVLYPEQVQQLFNFQGNTLRERRAKDYWFFCYLCNGINFKDLAYMRFKNIQEDTIVFVREKTKRTNTVANKEIRAYLHPELKRIIHEWGNKNGSLDDFVFPILNNYHTALTREKRRKEFQKKVNEKLTIIGKRLGFPKSLILNLARHSFGTNLKLNGTPIAFITDALGHADGKTTEHYLKSIPDQRIKEISDSLLKFQ